MIVKVQGANFFGTPTVTFGQGITVLSPPIVSPGNSELTARISIAPDANLGPRAVQVQNPSGESGGGGRYIFSVQPAGIGGPTAAEENWGYYE